jgi:BirA family biotin operon repressor/biotin-[acetyl-CoA-carboxylase] ligase
VKDNPQYLERLVSVVEPEAIRKCLKHLNLKPQVVVLSSVDSTNDEAKRRIKSGLDGELLVLSEIQTRGRGRLRRTWFSPKGGLYFSLVISPILKMESAPLHGFLCACAVVNALQKMGVDGARLKWPNDVLVSQHKVAGILSELVSRSHDDHLVVLGIGINLNTDTSVLPEAIRYSATSVIEHLGNITSPEEMLCEVLTFVDHWIQIVRSEGSFKAVLAEWRRVSATLGARIRIDDGARVYVGTAKELLDDGSLLVETENGKVVFSMGDVIHLRED